MSSVGITESQKVALDALVCERFSADAGNLGILRGFENEKGTLLLEYALEHGFDEDARGDTAFYIVKSKSNEGLFFFSLKCGELFAPLKEDEMRANLAESLVISQAVLNVVDSVDDKLKMVKKLKELGLSKGMPIKELLNVFRGNKAIRDVLARLEQDIKMEPNTNVARVKKTYSGIQLVHFCSNRSRSAKDLWASLAIDRPMGEVLFWRFVAPIFLNIRKLVGCEYAFLYAADMSLDLSLIHYYEQGLKFAQDPSLGANKPAYDFCCAFMCQPLIDLESNLRRYFEHFNVHDV